MYLHKGVSSKRRTKKVKFGNIACCSEANFDVWVYLSLGGRGEAKLLCVAPRPPSLPLPQYPRNSQIRRLFCSTNASSSSSSSFLSLFSSHDQNSLPLKPLCCPHWYNQATVPKKGITLRRKSRNTHTLPSFFSSLDNNNKTKRPGGSGAIIYGSPPPPPLFWQRRMRPISKD